MKFFRILFLLLTLNLFSQEGFQIENNKNVKIPFKFINNLIFIPVNVNGVELTFLLDSGVNETILFSLDNKEINFEKVEKMKFSGLGGTLQIEGLKAINNKVSISKSFSDKSHTIFIILDEEFNFSSHIGIPVNGIIGYSFFKNHRIKIDYPSKKITVYKNANSSNVPKSYEEFPITIELNKPYIQVNLQQINEIKPSKMLLDLGNSDAIWLFPSLIPGFQYNRPNIDDFLGRGFNGDVYGKRSRIHSLHIGKFKIEKPITAMPDEYSIQNLRIVKDRQGSIGSETLRRFNLIFDYPANKLFLKKNNFFNEPFHFNMSGLDIKHDGMFWDKDMVRVENPTTKSSANEDKPVYTATSEFQYRFILKPEYSVAGSRVDSPAYIAGVRKGDKILKINGKKAGDMSLEQINSLLKSEVGKIIKMEIVRKNKKMDVEFVLEDPIPYQEN